MIGRIARSLAAAGLGIALVVGLAPSALAHEGRPTGDGDLLMVVGFGTEPAYAGQPNSVQLLLEHDGDPVVDLGDTLVVEVAFGDETMALELEPFFAVGEFGTPGDYRAWFIPTRAGQYEFHFSGTIDREEIDETFTSGPDTFSDVENPADIEFPVQDPTTGELAERIDREVPRLTEQIDEVRSAATAASTELDQAADDASTAKIVGLIGIVVGAIGLLVGIGALILARRKAA
ncbi:MAG: hypothetical protein ACRDHU_12505 [Actinomycetota bacterium]